MYCNSKIANIFENLRKLTKSVLIVNGKTDGAGQSRDIATLKRMAQAFTKLADIARIKLVDLECYKYILYNK